MSGVTHIHDREEIIANRQFELKQMVAEYDLVKRRCEYLAQFIMRRGIELQQIKQARQPIQLTFEDLDDELLPPSA